ncbi:diguanylate cyclase (GGDEF)-like protein [Neorhizobium huautlense]|uniref:Diguanylate cyclase (GGDEF)-like protein n=1 Tax=Neorhizobium huautlense TaxID=67774 RepID=A0ABT9PZF6_9HYPH|nr:GGDEF domain-containing protein [Neorhizobium huautlense]MDP9839094.1 diguanylate cyclase (GGDEF)-like protein [Neorhizobium huautlense]
MSAEAAKTAPKNRILLAVSQQMARLEITGLPRNYELFHEAITGGDAALTRDVMGLNPGPTQIQLDEIGLRHRLPSFMGLSANVTRKQDIELIAGLSEKVARGVSQKQTFARALESVARSLRSDSSGKISDVLSEIEYLTSSISEAMTAETELTTALKSSAEKLAASEKATSSAREASLRDRLTSLPNHIALSERLEGLYSATAEGRRTALFLVSLNRLFDITQVPNDTVGNRVLKKSASIFRNTIKKNDFVARIGPREFAFLFDNVGQESVGAIADRLNNSIINGLQLISDDNKPAVMPMELSIGVALTDDAYSPQELRSRAAVALDSALANPRQPVVIGGGKAVARTARG